MKNKLEEVIEIKDELERLQKKKYELEGQQKFLMLKLKKYKLKTLKEGREKLIVLKGKFEQDQKRLNVAVEKFIERYSKAKRKE